MSLTNRHLPARRPPPPAGTKNVCMKGDDVCALEMELSREARAPPADTDQLFSDNNTQKSTRRMPGEGEDFEVPVVLMTLGWDPAGDPTHREDALGRDRACVFRVLEMPRVKRWFTSHTRYDSHTDELVSVVPQCIFFYSLGGVVY